MESLKPLIHFICFPPSSMGRIIDTSDLDHEEGNMMYNTKYTDYYHLPSNLRDLKSTVVKIRDGKFFYKPTTAQLMQALTEDDIRKLTSGQQLVVVFRNKGYDPQDFSGQTILCEIVVFDYQEDKVVKPIVYNI